MSESSWPGIDRLARALIPTLSTLVLVIIAQLPLAVPYLDRVTPALALIAVYYWSIYRPDLLPAVVVFAIGLIQDLLSGTPVGLTALVLLLVHGIVVSQRRVFLGMTFLVEWWGFLLVASGAAAFAWLAASLLFATLLPPGPVAAQWLLTVGLYPLLTWLISRMRRSLTRAA